MLSFLSDSIIHILLVIRFTKEKLIRMYKRLCYKYGNKHICRTLKVIRQT